MCSYFSLNDSYCGRLVVKCKCISLDQLQYLNIACVLDYFNGAPRVGAEKYIFCAQNTDEIATRL